MHAIRSCVFIASRKCSQLPQKFTVEANITDVAVRILKNEAGHRYIELGAKDQAPVRYPLDWHERAQTHLDVALKDKSVLELLGNRIAKMNYDTDTSIGRKILDDVVMISVVLSMCALTYLLKDK